MSIRGGSSLEKSAGGMQESIFKQEKAFLAQRDQQHILRAEEYHVVKTKDFNVIGKLRQEKVDVKALKKSSAVPELNEKYLDFVKAI